jgi:methionyl-tRNA formyltransferase
MKGLERIIFLGSSAFAVPSLERLIKSEAFKPAAIITQRDKPAGRNLQTTFTPVKQLALDNNLPVFQPEDINSAEAVEYLSALQPDLLITIAYGQKLKKAVRTSAKLGAINLHPSLLPELRGAAPIPFALWNGQIQTGLTIFQLTSRMDAGPVWFSKPLFIFPDENATELAERLAYIGSLCLLQFLQKWPDQQREPVPQDETQATYCRKLAKADLLLDWNQPAQEIRNRIRALAVSPGAYTFFRGQQLKILQAEIIEEASDLPVGSIVSITKNAGFSVQAQDKQLFVRLVQPSGKKVMAAWAFHLGTRLVSGERMDSHA